jgi:hypothetical protein
MSLAHKIVGKIIGDRTSKHRKAVSYFNVSGHSDRGMSTCFNCGDELQGKKKYKTLDGWVCEDCR